MEASVFRAVAAALTRALPGRRFEKIFRPVEGIWNFVLTAPGGKRFLVLRQARSDGLLYLTDIKPSNPATAPAAAMWMRKRLSGRRALSVVADWPTRRLAVELSPGEGTHLLLDLREGPSLPNGLPGGFGLEPEWPTAARILEDPEVWREHPQVSPALRRRLAVMNPADAQEFLDTLASGAPQVLHLVLDADRPVELTAWPPENAAGALALSDPLEAARRFGEPLAYARLADVESHDFRLAAREQAKKLKRTLARIDLDRERLAGMAAEHATAEALRAELWKFADGPTPETIRIAHPELGEVSLPMNTHLSVSENMQRIFERAAKGRRGLAVVEERKRSLLLERGAAVSAPASAQTDAPNAPVARGGEAPLPARLQGLAVKVYRSSDGFTLVRGKNAKANHKLLSQAASPHDLWLHVADVPGAHVIIKRDHPGQVVPQRSLEEAAVLAALSSGKAGEAKADVMCALVRHVRKVKGAELGHVRVEPLEAMLRVAVRPELEQELQV